MSRIVQKFHPIEKDNCSYVAITGNVQLNLRNNEWGCLCSMKLMKVCMVVMKYEDECSKNMKFELIHTKLCSIGGNSFSYLPVTENIVLNQQKNERYLCSMKVSASKICNESNDTKIEFIQGKTTVLTLLLLTMFY